MITLSYQATSVDLPDNTLPEEPGDFSAQLVRGTIGGDLIGVELATNLHSIPVLHFNNINDIDYGALRQFIITTIKRSKELFQYTDRYGTIWNVKYVSGIPGSRVENPLYWTITLTLRNYGVV